MGGTIKQSTIGVNMTIAYNVYSTKDYNKFKHFLSNREVSEKHVEKLISSEGFIESIPYSPIKVTPSLRILDGQHRLEACRRLDIDVHYIIDPTSSQYEIKKFNANMLTWSYTTFIKHYAALHQETYKLILEIMQRENILLVHLNPILDSCAKRSSWKYNYQLKNGTLEFTEKEITTINDICKKLFPALKECIASKGKDLCKPIMTREYLKAFYYFYSEDRTTFNEILQKMKICSHLFPYCGTFESAKQALLQVAKWKTPKTSMKGLNEQHQVKKVSRSRTKVARATA